MLSLVNAQSFDIQPYVDLILSNDLYKMIAGGVLGYLLLILIAVIVGIVKNIKSKSESKKRVLSLRAEKEAEINQEENPDEFDQKQIDVSATEDDATEDEVIEDEATETSEADNFFASDSSADFSLQDSEESTEEETPEEYAEEESEETEEESEETEDEIVEEESEEIEDEIVEEESEETEDEIVEEAQEEVEEEIQEETEPVAEEEVVEPTTEEDDAFEYVTYEPDEEEPVAPVEEEPVAPVEEEPVAPVEEVVEPIAEEEIAPVVEEEKAPAQKKKSTKNAPTALSMQIKKAKKAKVEEEKAIEEQVESVEEDPQIEPEEEVQPVEEAEKKSTRYVGKWKIKEIGEGEFSSFLYASNGQLLLTSEVYASADGARSGIATITKNVALEKFEIHSDKNGRYFYKVKSSANRLLCVGETYNTKLACLKSVASVKKFCANAIILDVIEKDITIIKYVPHDEIEVKAGYDGKWKIEGYDDFYMAKLFASNGELLLVGESFKLYDSAKANIETIRKNALASNFIIDKDKKGKFYYKLRNAQKSILCVGESYDTQIGAERAIESVKRFAKTAKLVETPPTTDEE